LFEDLVNCVEENVKSFGLSDVNVNCCVYRLTVVYVENVLCCIVWAGPFWICTTLVFTVAVAGNLANYFHSAGEDYKWKYDFHKGLCPTATITRVTFAFDLITKSARPRCAAQQARDVVSL